MRTIGRRPPESPGLRAEDSHPEAEGVRCLLRGLAADDPEPAWRSFLEAYFPLVVQVAELQEHDEDRAGDCAVFVCERLWEDGFRRLLTLDPERGVRFARLRHLGARQRAVA